MFSYSEFNVEFKNSNGSHCNVSPCIYAINLPSLIEGVINKEKNEEESQSDTDNHDDM